MTTKAKVAVKVHLRDAFSGKTVCGRDVVNLVAYYYAAFYGVVKDARCAFCRRKSTPRGKKT